MPERLPGSTARSHHRYYNVQQFCDIPSAYPIMTLFAFFPSLRQTAAACVVGYALLASGCAIYKPEVIQGNFVSQEAIAQLRPGMPREAVSQILGTPLLRDMFRSGRWDYVFSIKHRPGVPEQHYAVTLFFQDNVLARVEGAQSLPTEADFVQAISNQRTPRERVLQADAQQLEAFLENNRYTDPSTSPDTSPAAVGGTN